MYLPIPDTYFVPFSSIYDGAFKISQQLLAVIYFPKKVHPRCMMGF